MAPAKPHALERLRRAEKGEVALFWSRYGGAGEGLILKAVCADGGEAVGVGTGDGPAGGEGFQAGDGDAQHYPDREGGGGGAG
ncbi:hypothetical protein [Desulfovirgula thermocuniculi]|uniref:hypothetical protein n=1 Tax=Desulfovirgula thermocuniculi TaxID=348842 RepID=UPI0003FA51DA|nr:hypothetical protein [Desulfovirgula thermocuniculi]